MKRPKSKIRFFVNCAMCTDTVPDGESYESYARLSAGFTKDGKMQVWCVRHNAEVLTIGPESFAAIMHRIAGMNCSCCHAPVAGPAVPPGTYVVEVCRTADSAPFRTVTRVATDHPDGGWQSVAFQGRRYQMYERNPGQFWIDLSDPGRASVQ